MKENKNRLGSHNPPFPQDAAQGDGGMNRRAGVRQFFSFVRKEFHHIFRDKRTMFILLGMPIVEIIIFGFALTNEVKNARIAVFDNSKDASSQSLTSQLNASRYFDVEENLYSYDGIENAFK